MPNPNLKPSSTNGIEFGLEASFLNDRLSVDLSWYRQVTTDQILQSNISNTSGYDRFVTNVGELRNSGIEFLVSGIPVKAGDFEWEASFNFSKNNNEVINVGFDNEGNPIETLNIGDNSRFGGVQVQARVGEPYGQLVGQGWLRDASGRIIHDTNGFPIADPEARVLGNGIPDWIGGLTNTFTYKGLSLSFLIDIQQGGDLFSTTSLQAMFRGLDSRTLEGREGGIVGDGVNEAGEVNAVNARAEDYLGANCS